tara:strand:- start:7318 stop:8067 length:750 start_codon:yes stop_codon:yes gene_type:complete
MALTKVTSGVRTLAANEVATTNIADDAVTGPKIAMGSDAQGDILFRGSSNYERLAKGTAGQTLQMNSGATAPEWADDGYRAGEVIEEIWLPQNGTSQTVLSGTYTGANITAYQDLTDSYADVTGSAINYTPPSAATRVVYSLHLYASHNAISFSHYKTYLDSTEVTAARANNNRDYIDNVQAFTWVFLIGGSANAATGQVATWTSAKQIKMQARRYSSTYTQKLHQTYYWDGATAAQMHVPIINIKAIK